MPQERKPLILVSDDDAPFLQLISKVLLNEGYDVISAEGGDRALRAILHNAIDLCLLDINTRNWSGIDLCRIIKSSPDSRLTPVVLLTGDTTVSIRMEAIEAGADGFFEKPIDKRQVLARVRSL